MVRQRRRSGAQGALRGRGRGGPQRLAPSHGHCGQKPTPQEHDQILDLLADLHSRTPPETTPVTVLDPAGRGSVDTALREPVGEWRGGPFSELARDLFAENVGLLHARLEEFD
ncbi:MAG: hypothetical protein ACRDRW_01300 [Pseudonocardiaceae bacterium]